VRTRGPVTANLLSHSSVEQRVSSRKMIGDDDDHARRRVECRHANTTERLMYNKRLVYKTLLTVNRCPNYTCDVLSQAWKRFIASAADARRCLRDCVYRLADTSYHEKVTSKISECLWLNFAESSCCSFATLQ